MKLTKSQLRQIIREEMVKNTLSLNKNMKSVNEGIGTIALGVAGGLLLLKILKFVLKKVVGGVGMNVKLPKEKLLEIVEETFESTKVSSSVNKREMMELQSYLKDEINAGRITTVKQIVQVVDEASKKNKNESVNEAKLKSIIRSVIKEEMKKINIKEGGHGVLDRDQSDVLEGIVLMNSKKSDDEIAAIAMKNPMFKGVKKKDLLVYIDEIRMIYGK